MRDVQIDCRDGMEAIHRQLSEALDFPDWYGANLDALYDCLTDLGEPVCLTVREPQLLPALERVLEDAAGENPLLEVWMSQ